MPARPLSDESLQLIAAVREALAHRDDVEERPLFGWFCFFVDGKLCLGVKNEELLVRLAPADHDRVAEKPGVRELDSRGGMSGYFCVEPTAFATRHQWQEWVDAALAWNPSAKASPRRKKTATNNKATPAKKAATSKKRHSIFESDP
ncbi:TfoX/Sxy family protein [Diaphorobacter aerolatus]|uniref:TfoX/Sxy family protein n=1 Tax=Diaphorobacter aerolatus TaxID=1288495 RepID=A0A7H0GKY8_9BURK|nr:TfoX/Sxy family protein [Diaphorobacter aerolatus]QNP48954.1 TfoX/Sxy family protein [Diaphorobacter aerolatus]